MGAEAPQWLFNSFVSSLQEIGVTAPVSELDVEARDLVARWSDPNRHVHTTRHLIDILAYLDELAVNTHDPDVLRIAAWYHGAFLSSAIIAHIDDSDPTAACHSCCTQTGERLAPLGVSEDVIARVKELITYLVTHEAPLDDLDAQALVDANLAHLADSPQSYKKYREELREEFSWLNDIVFLRARRRIVRRLLARENVFSTPRAKEWEEHARANLSVELAKLNDEIEALDPDSSHEFFPDNEALLAEMEEQSPRADDSTTTTGTLIIKRRLLKKNAASHHDNDEFTATGTLPAIAPADTSAQEPSEDEDGASSLETAIDALDVPTQRPDPADETHPSSS